MITRAILKGNIGKTLLKSPACTSNRFVVSKRKYAGNVGLCDCPSFIGSRKENSESSRGIGVNARLVNSCEKKALPFPLDCDTAHHEV